MTDTLLSKHCVPCEGGTAPLTSDEERKYLDSVPEWQLITETPHHIERDITLKNFKQALAFINEVGELAENEGHHPNIYLHDFKKVKIELYTHAIGGLSENDFIMAVKIDEILKARYAA